MCYIIQFELNSRTKILNFWILAKKIRVCALIGVALELDCSCIGVRPQTATAAYMLAACGHYFRGAGVPRGGCMRVSATTNPLKVFPAASRPPPLARRAKWVERLRGPLCPPTFGAPAAGAATAAGTRRGRHIGRRTYYCGMCGRGAHKPRPRRGRRQPRAPTRPRRSA